MFKQDLLRRYPELTPVKLSYILNVELYEELSALGYRKTQKFLSPAVVRKFIEYYGTPLNDDDFTDDY